MRGSPPNPQHIQGQTFNRLTAVELIGPGNSTQSNWLFRCTCGTMTRARVWSVLNGRIKSCGCLRREDIGNRRRKHGMSDTPEHYAWRHIRARCFNPRDQNYSDYGGRGITVSFSSFAAFLAEIGARPGPGYTVDRMDVNGHYEPGNVRWATRLEQGENRRDNYYITFNGKTQHLSAWAREIGMNKATLKNRLRTYGWSVERALSEPTRGSKQ